MTDFDWDSYADPGAFDMDYAVEAGAVLEEPVGSAGRRVRIPAMDDYDGVGLAPWDEASLLASEDYAFSEVNEWVDVPKPMPGATESDQPVGFWQEFFDEFGAVWGELTEDLGNEFDDCPC